MRGELKRGTMAGLPCRVVYSMVYVMGLLYVHLHMVHVTYKVYVSSAQTHKLVWCPRTAASHHILHSAKQNPAIISLTLMEDSLGTCRAHSSAQAAYLTLLSIHILCLGETLGNRCFANLVLLNAS